MGERTSSPMHYGLALAGALAALATRWLLHPVFGDQVPFALSFLAVLLALKIGGFGPAMLAMVVGGAGVMYLFVPPAFSLAVPAPTDLAGLGLFVVVSVAVGWVGSRLRSAEATARRTQRELLDTFENASIGMHWVGPDGVILRANATELHMLGYSADEYVGRHIADFHADRAVIDDMLRRLYAGQSVESQPARLRCKDGSIRNVLIDSSPFLENGSFAHTRCFTRDITQRTLAQEAMRRSDERLQLALMAGGMGTWDWDILTGEVAWSPGLEQIHGLEIGGFDGTFDAFQRDIHPDDRQRVLQDIERSVRNGGEHRIEYRLRRPDGSVRWVEGRGMLLHNDAGQPARMIGVCMDVTERKRAEEIMRESEHRFARFTQHLPGLAWIKDLEGRYAYVNDAATAAFGQPREVLCGKTDDEIFPPQTASKFRDNDRLAVERGSVQAIESLQHPDGTTHQSLVSKFAIPGPDGAPAWVGGMAIDVTDRVHMEQALRDSDRRKDEFLAISAHELRNPLAPIHAATQVMRAVGMDDPQLKWARDMIERQARLMSRLVDDLMDVSRITRGKVELRLGRVDVRDALTRALEMARPLIEARRHSVKLDVPDQPMWLQADATRLEQVFANLLNNAAKYTPEPGRIDVVAAIDGDRAVVSVRDNGAGIDPQLLPRVFDMFVQAGSDRTGVRGGLGGLGIGLSLVRTLVQMHGGIVEARSDGPGRGSVFTVRLPGLLASAPADRVEPVSAPAGSTSLPGRRPSPEAQPLPAADTQPRTIVVVDDNRDVAESLAVFLRLQGHQVVVAHDANSGLESFARVKPDLMFLDIGMPVVDGCEMARRIRSRCAADGDDVRLVALTGWGQPEDLRRSQEAGFDHHLVKPVEPQTLLTIVRDATLPRGVLTTSFG